MFYDTNMILLAPEKISDLENWPAPLVAFHRTSQMLKGYAPMYIPTEYNPKRINLNGVPVYITIISTDQSSAGSTSA